MNGKAYTYRQSYTSPDFMPKKIDTFAVSVPGLRGYFKLRIWDLTASGEEDDDEPWSDATLDASFLQ